MQGQVGCPGGGPRHPFLIFHTSPWASLTRTLPPQIQSPPNSSFCPLPLKYSPSTLDMKPTYRCAKPPPRGPIKALCSHKEEGIGTFILHPSPVPPHRDPFPPSPAQPKRGLDPRAYNSQQALQQEPLAGGVWETNCS